MAELLSEDTDCPSSLRLNFGGIKVLGDQQWQKLEVEVVSGCRQLKTLENEDCFLCREPKDELVQLVGNLKLLLGRNKDHVLFEPSEPSVELELVRTQRGGIRVQAWLDAGNGTTGTYTWDACGIRFATTDEKVAQFVEDLSAHI